MLKQCDHVLPLSLLSHPDVHPYLPLTGVWVKWVIFGPWVPVGSPKNQAWADTEGREGSRDYQGDKPPQKPGQVKRVKEEKH